MIERVVPFLGFDYDHKCLVSIFEREASIKVDRSARLADESLLLVERTKFPLIFVNDTMAPGELRLPSGINIYDYAQISQYVIKSIRHGKQNRETPIIALVAPTVCQDYINAGATKIYDWVNDHLYDFVNLARSYL